MASPGGLVNPHVQQALLGEAVAAASVGVIVWDDERRYVAVNATACSLLGVTLDAVLGSRVGDRTENGETLAEEAIRRGHAQGRASVDRFDGSGQTTVEYLTFLTRTSGLPYMASVIWPAVES